MPFILVDRAGLRRLGSSGRRRDKANRKREDGRPERQVPTRLRRDQPDQG